MTIPTALSEDPFGFTGLTYDDVLLLPGNTDVIPSDADTSTRLSKRITLNTPIISAAMDTVTDSAMAIAMARLGGMGVIHRNLSIEDQAAHVDRVKRSESGMIINPVTIGADATIAEYDEVCGYYKVSGLPVVSEEGVPLRLRGHSRPRYHDPHAAGYRAPQRHQGRSICVAVPQQD